MVIEQALGLLKSKWRILLRRQDTNFENFHYVISACFILHNICINDDDIYLEDQVEHIDIANDNNHEANANVMRDYLSYLV